MIPELGRDAPIVGSLGEAIELSPTSILVGLAPSPLQPHHITRMIKS
jgi:hypothetical protein